MKKVLLPICAVLFGAALSSCDNAYDLGKIDNTVDVSVKVEDAQPQQSAQSLIGVETTTGANGELVAKGATVKTAPSCTPAEFAGGARLLNADAKIELPLAKSGKFPSEDVYSALENPSIVIEVSNTTGSAFNYSGNIVAMSGTKFPFSVDIPAKEGKYSVYLSASGKAAPAKENALNATVKDFLKVFAGSPASIDIKDVTVKAATTKAIAPSAEGNVNFELSYSGNFPLVLKKGSSFTLRETIDASKVNFKDYAGIKKVKVYAKLKHNIPFTIAPKLVQPEDIKATCTSLNAANYPAMTEQELVLEGECPTGLKPSYKEAVVDLTIKYEGDKEVMAFKGDMSTQLTITKYTISQ